jgi:lipoate-protein ligase A
MNQWRLVDGEPLPGRLNMALDEALLRLHERGESPPTLRLYRWSPPAVSLGYFQRRHGLDLEACRRLGLEVVRRPTGGRAVLHLNELTYAVVAGAAEGMPSSPPAAYRLLCEGLLAGLRLLGVGAGLGREAAKPPQPEVCFLRQTGADIVHRGRKLVGSAQTWRGSSLLQHGSIVLEPQAEALAALFGAAKDELGARLTSLSEILGRGIEAGEVGGAIRQGLVQTLGVSFEAGEIGPEEWALAQGIAAGAESPACPARATPGLRPAA